MTEVIDFVVRRANGRYEPGRHLVSGPWREQQQEAGVGAGMHGVSFVGGEGDHETCTAGHAHSGAGVISTSPSITVTHALS